MIQEIDMATYHPQLRTALIMADYGGGKTHLCGTARKPLMVFSFDKGYDTIALQPGIKVVSILEENRRRPTAWREFCIRFDKWLVGEEYTWPDGRKERYKTGALDSGTFLSQYCLNHFQAINNNIDRKATYTEYQQIKENMSDVLAKIKRMTEYMLMTALLRTDKDEQTGEVLTQPNIIGSLRDELGAHFDAVFYLYVERKPQGKEEYYMKTVGGYRERGKIRLPVHIKAIVKPIEEPDFGKLLDKIEARVREDAGQIATPVKEKPMQQEAAPVKQPVAAKVAPKPALPKPIPRPASQTGGKKA